MDASMVKSYKWMLFLAKRIILQVGLPKKRRMVTLRFDMYSHEK